MRARVRNVIATALFAFAVLMGGYFVGTANELAQDTASAESAIPQVCRVPELDILTLAPPSADSTGFIAKQQEVKSALANCIANATQHPAVEKSTAVLLPLRLPTVEPRPTSTPVLGLRHSQAMWAGGPFMPTHDGLNVWTAFVDADLVTVGAGWIRDADENWTVGGTRPTPGMRQGAVNVYVNYGETIVDKPTPSRGGAVHFLVACDLLLVLEAEDGTIFTFDAGTLTYVENSAACPVPGE